MKSDANPEQGVPVLVMRTRVALGFAALCGVGVAVAGLAGFVGDVPSVLAILMMLLGAATVMLATHALKRSRAAWSFLCSISVTLTIGFLFGGPKIEPWLGWGTLAAYVPAMVCAITSALLISSRSEY